MGQASAKSSRAVSRRPVAPRVILRSAWATRRFNRPFVLFTTASSFAGARHPVSPGNSGSLWRTLAGGYCVETSTNIGWSQPIPVRERHGQTRFQAAAFMTR
jgi:hypothetical protein